MKFPILPIKQKQLKSNDQILKSEVKIFAPKKTNKGRKPKNGFDKRKGDINRTGLNKGCISQKTKVMRGLEAIAKMTGKKPEDIEDNLFIVGYNKAQLGEFAFWSAMINLIHGLPGETKDKPIFINLLEESRRRLKDYES